MAQRQNSSYNHTCKKLRFAADTFSIGWTVDHKYPNSRLRHPRQFSKVTDRTGAERFCKRWGIPMEYAS